jgi:hypothetical protein
MLRSALLLTAVVAEAGILATQESQLRRMKAEQPEQFRRLESLALLSDTETPVASAFLADSGTAFNQTWLITAPFSLNETTGYNPDGSGTIDYVDKHALPKDIRAWLAENLPSTDRKALLLSMADRANRLLSAYDNTRKMYVEMPYVMPAAIKLAGQLESLSAAHGLNTSEIEQAQSFLQALANSNLALAEAVKNINREQSQGFFATTELVLKTRINILIDGRPATNPQLITAYQELTHLYLALGKDGEARKMREKTKLIQKLSKRESSKPISVEADGSTHSSTVTRPALLDKLDAKNKQAGEMLRVLAFYNPKAYLFNSYIIDRLTIGVHMSDLEATMAAIKPQKEITTALETTLKDRFRTARFTEFHPMFDPDSVSINLMYGLQGHRLDPAFQQQIRDSMSTEEKQHWLLESGRSIANAIPAMVAEDVYRFVSLHLLPHCEAWLNHFERIFGFYPELAESEKKVLIAVLQQTIAGLKMAGPHNAELKLKVINIANDIHEPALGLQLRDSSMLFKTTGSSTKQNKGQAPIM